MRVFVDSNIPMYVAGRDHPFREPARRFLESAREARFEAVTSTEVLQEILYRYVSLRRPDLAIRVYDLFVQLCPVVLPVTLADTDRAHHLLAELADVSTSVRDLLHASVMLNNDIDTVATFDRAFARIPGIKIIDLT